MEVDDYAGIFHSKSYDYYIIKLIGEGETSFVYQCQKEDSSIYAIKLYTNKHSFQQETSIFSKLPRSKSIVQLINYGQGTIECGDSLESFTIAEHFVIGEEINYVLLEYLPNGELFDYIHFVKRGFCEQIVKYLFIQVLEAVDLCHINGIIHSDIKLENILLSNTLELKLIDFGCAKEINENDFRQYNWSGTIKYSAPEVHYSPETLGYDGVKNDIFSLGIMLFTLLFGFYPFSKPNIADTVYKLLVEEEYCTFWAKFEHITECSENFKALFNRMVCFDPKERINIEEIKIHPWLIEEDNQSSYFLTHERFEKEFNKRKRIVDEKKK